VALDLVNGVANSIHLVGGEAGSGAMASEIGEPLNPTDDNAVICYIISRSDYPPSVKYATWNHDTNTVNGVYFLQMGNVTPEVSGQCASGRYNDFIDAAGPIPNSNNMLVCGTYGNFNNGDSWCSIYCGVLGAP
jgi:hypothetical protein